VKAAPGGGQRKRTEKPMVEHRKNPSGGLPKKKGKSSGGGFGVEKNLRKKESKWGELKLSYS